MTWRIEACKAPVEGVSTHELLVSYVTAYRCWKRLTKIQRAAIEAAYPDKAVIAGKRTLRCLYDRGFIETGDVLTDAGKACARINISKEHQSGGDQ